MYNTNARQLVSHASRLLVPFLRAVLSYARQVKISETEQIEKEISLMRQRKPCPAFSCVTNSRLVIGLSHNEISANLATEDSPLLKIRGLRGVAGL